MTWEVSSPVMIQFITVFCINLEKSFVNDMQRCFAEVNKFLNTTLPLRLNALTVIRKQNYGSVEMQSNEHLFVLHVSIRQARWRIQ